MLISRLHCAEKHSVLRTGSLVRETGEDRLEATCCGVKKCSPSSVPRLSIGSCISPLLLSSADLTSRNAISGSRLSQEGVQSRLSDQSPFRSLSPGARYASESTCSLLGSARFSLVPPGVRSFRTPRIEHET